MNFSFLQKECNGTYFMKYIVYRKINHPARKLNRLFESEILTKKFTYDGRKYSVELILSLNILVVGISRFQNLNGLKHIKRYDSRSFYQIFNHPRTFGFYGVSFFPKAFSQTATSQGYFTAWQVPKCAKFQAVTSQGLG